MSAEKRVGGNTTSIAEALSSKLAACEAERAVLVAALRDVKAALGRYADGPATPRELAVERVVTVALAQVGR